MSIDNIVGIVGGALGVASFVVQMLDKRPRIGVRIQPMLFAEGRTGLFLVVYNNGVAPFTVCGTGVCYNGRDGFGTPFKHVDQGTGAKLDVPEVVQQGTLALYEIPEGAYDGKHESALSVDCRCWELYVNLPSGQKWNGENKGDFAAYCRAALQDATVEPDEWLAAVANDP